MRAAQGLYRLFAGALLQHLGEACERRRRRGTGRATGVDARRARRRGIRLRDDVPAAAAPGGLARRRRHAERARDDGRSVLVAGDQRALKVHVHSERPDQVIGYGLGSAELSRISVENLDAQARDVRERRASAFTGGASAGPTPRARRRPRRRRRPTASGRPRAVGVIAVAAGDGLGRSSSRSGCRSAARVVRGGQAPTRAPASCSRRSRRHAGDVLLLPNNPNVILAARQVAAMADRPVTSCRRATPPRAGGAPRARPASRGRQRRGDDRGRPARSRPCR